MKIIDANGIFGYVTPRSAKRLSLRRARSKAQPCEQAGKFEKRNEKKQNFDFANSKIKQQNCSVLFKDWSFFWVLSFNSLAITRSKALLLIH